MIRLVRRYVLLSVACLPCCSPPAPEPELRMPRAIVDLSPSLRATFPVDVLGQTAVEVLGIPPETDFAVNVAEEPFYAADAVLSLFNHVGPHHDPPNHVIQGAKSTDEFSLDRFFGRAKLFDFRSKPKDEPLLPKDFEDAAIEPGDIVLVTVGYVPPSAPGELPSYAYLSGEAAEYLASIPIKAFASDMPSLGSIKRYLELIEEGKTGSETIVPEHYAFLSRDIPNIEGLVHMDRLVGESDIVFVGFPLKIEDGNGAPMRAAALVY